MRQKITKEFIRDHITYSARLYIGLILFATIGWSIIFTVTRYVPPPEKQLIVYFVSDYFYSDKAVELEESMRAAFPDIETVGVYGVGLNTEEGQQKFMLLLATNEVDIFVLDGAYALSLAQDGLVMPLDDAIDAGVLAGIEGIEAYRFALRADEGLGISAEPRVYAVPTSHLYGLMRNYYFDSRNAVMLGMTMGGNPDETPELMRLIYDTYYEEEDKDFINNFEQWIDLMRDQLTY